MKEQFIDKKFASATLKMISRCNQILDEYEAQGYRLTLRQLYYQVVRRDAFPQDRRWRWTGAKWVRDANGTWNADPNYKWLGGIVSEARQAGLLDWDMLEDRNREQVTPPHWNSPASILRACARDFRIDKWDGQEYVIRVMVEKDALSGIIQPVCTDLDIRFLANKGYSSSSMMYELGNELAEDVDNGKRVCVIYLGDHDASGIDMTRDVEDRLAMYSRLDPSEIEVVRVALNYDQTQDWNLLENPAKETDPRAQKYIDEFGQSSWELDAVEPAQLEDLIRDAVLFRRDDDAWDEAVEREQTMRDELKAMADNYKPKKAQ